MIQEQINGNSVASRPFVTDSGVVYFRGTDNRLWRVNSDGTDQVQVGNNHAASTPFVTTDGWVWFQGIDDKLWKVYNDGTQQSQPGNNQTASSPVVVGDYVYFRGTDNKLWRMKTDGSAQNVINNSTTKDRPSVTPDGWVWFQGTDDKLWKVATDGSQQSQPGNNNTASSPVVMGEYVYFRGTDNKLWRMKTDGSIQNVINNNSTKDTPFVTVEGWVWFWGIDDKLWRVFTDGTQQSQPGNNNTSSTPTVGRMAPAEGTVGEWTYFQGTDNKLWRLFLPATAIATGTMRPKFYILSVLYAPPGANGGKGGSSVDYSTGSSTGTSTSVSKSKKDGVTVAASGAVKLGPVKLGGSGDFSASTTTTDTSSQTITKSQTIDYKVLGPGTDGINHDHDLILIMLNPLVEISVFPGDNMLWNMGVDGTVMTIATPYVGWLRNPSTMPPGVKQQLDAAGLGTADYTTLLGANPFAQGNTEIDPKRFLATPQTFTYEPPLTAADSVNPTSINTQNIINISEAHTTVHEYSVSASVSAGIGDMAKNFLNLSVTGSMDWTNSNTYGISSSSTQSATAIVGGPAFGYGGPTDVLIYWDTLYSSFMFAFPSTPATAVGGIKDASGKPVAFKPITLSIAGKKFETITNQQGQYRVYGSPTGSGTLTVDGRTTAITMDEKPKPMVLTP